MKRKPPKPILRNRFAILRFLDDEYQKLYAKHYELSPKNGEIPVGGGDWMDMFFRTEGLRGMINKLDSNGTIKEALEDGKTVSEIAVGLWNKKREWQVHRWNKTCHTYLINIMGRAKKMDKDWHPSKPKPVKKKKRRKK